MGVPLDIFWDVQVVTMPTSGTFDIIADLGGNTPVGAIFLANGGDAINDDSQGEGCMPSIGFTDGTNQICVANVSEHLSNRSDHKNAGYSDEVVAMFNPSGSGGVDDLNINFDQWLTTTDTGTDQTGVRLNVGKNNDSFTKGIAVWLFAGTDVQFAVGSTALSTQDTWVDETGPGFEPDIVIALVNDAFGSTERAGYFYSLGIVHNGTSVVGHYTSFFREDNGDPPDCNKESDTTANHCGMHHTGSFLNTHEVECGQFDSSGMSFRARDADATDDVGWCAIELGGLQIDLRDYPFWTENFGDPHEESFSFQPGAMMMLRGCGFGTNGQNNSEMEQHVGMNARNQVNGVVSSGGISFDSTAASTNHRCSGVVLDGLAESVAVTADFTFSGDLDQVGGGVSSELTHLEFREFGAIHWRGIGPFSSVICDHNVMLVIEDPRPPVNLLGDVVRKRRTNPLVRM